MAKRKTAAPAKPVEIQNRIWIELDKPRDVAHAHQMAAQATMMMARLIPAKDLAGRSFWYDERRREYCWGGPMGYRNLLDRGEWFDLGFLADPKSK